MTLYLDSADVRRLCTQDLSLRAARSVLEAQKAGNWELPPRLDVDLPLGFFRVMPAAIGVFMGLKIMTLVRGVGNRYLLLLYAQDSGELVAVLDADEVTRLRTAATTAVAGQLLRPQGSSFIGLIGTGFEAEGHLRAFADMWPVSDVLVHSRSATRREDFAERMTAELGISVKPVATSEEVVAESPVTLLCTKSTTPVVDGARFSRGAIVLSIGSTRPDLRELDQTTLSRSAAVLVDDPQQVMSESGDIAAGLSSGALSRDRIVAMCDWTGHEDRADADRDLFTFKSVGTALHDLLLAAALVDEAKARGHGRELGELTSLKAAAEAPLVKRAALKGAR